MMNFDITINKTVIY